jgi:predicted O-methyltransferase YrrM
MKEAKKILKRLDRMGEKESLPSIGPVKGKIIADVIQDHEPKNILEIGTFYGYSSILMGGLPDEKGKVITIEIDKEYANIAKRI